MQVQFVNLDKHKAEYDNARKFLDEMKSVANRIFSSEDGKKYARQMLVACHYGAIDNGRFDDNALRYVVAQQDFVNRFLVNLVDRDVLLDILDYRKDK